MSVSALMVNLSSAVIILAFAGLGYIGVSATNESTNLKKQLNEVQALKNDEVLALQDKVKILTAELEPLKQGVQTQQDTATALTSCQHDLEAAKTMPRKKGAEVR
jgi:hypothetical protein